MRRQALFENRRKYSSIKQAANERKQKRTPKAAESEGEAA